MTEPIPLDPPVVAERGAFPAHTELPGRRLLTALEAKRQARQRLEAWRREHE